MVKGERHERVQGDRDHRDKQHFMGRRGGGGDQDRRRTLRDLRVVEVIKQDIHLDEGGAVTYRTKLQLSFKYEPGH